MTGDNDTTVHDADLTALARTVLGHDDGGFDPERVAAGTRFGRYRIHRLLGSGGMGAVYLAEQTEPVRRAVAIKLLAHARISPERYGLFEIERQALAQMNHPAIAQIHDAGTTDEGMPYLVMEHVDGISLDAHVRTNRPNLRERMRLVHSLCLGVEHAHQRRIIHCDIKPGNILITRVDGRPQPKLIDFGIARTLGERSGAHTGGTPAYMSPEQLEPGRAVDTRSDVYSLGVVLFELLSEQPYRDPDTLRSASLDDIRKRLRALDHRALPTDAAVAGLPARRRAELDAILSHALAAEPECRYPTASAFAADLGRWLAGEPVQAMAGGRFYRLRCFVRRNALTCALSALALAALGAGAIGLYGGLREARLQAAIAQARGVELEKVVAFQQRVITQIDVGALTRSLVNRLVDAHRKAAASDGETDERALFAAERLRADLESATPVDATRSALHEHLLSSAAALIDSEYASGDAVEAALRLALVEIYLIQGLLDDAELQLRPVLENLSGVLGPSHRRSLEGRVLETALLYQRGRFSDVLDLAVPVLERCDQWLGRLEFPCRRLLRMIGLARHRLGDSAGAMQEFSSLLDRHSASDGPLHPQTLRDSITYFEFRLHHEQVCSPTLKREIDALLARVEDRDDLLPLRRTAVSQRGICDLLDADFPAMLARYQQALDLSRRIDGYEHLVTLDRAIDVAIGLTRTGAFDAAVDMLERVRQTVADLGGVDGQLDSRLASAQALLGSSLGNREAALHSADQMVELDQHRFGTQHPRSLFALLQRAEIRLRAGELQGAMHDLADLRHAFSTTHAPTRLERYWADTIELETLAAGGGEWQADAAERLLVEMRELVVPSHLLVLRVADVLARHYRDHHLDDDLQRIRNDHLAWLENVDPQRLGYEQRVIRQRWISEATAP